MKCEKCGYLNYQETTSLCPQCGNAMQKIEEKKSEAGTKRKNKNLLIILIIVALFVFVPFVVGIVFYLFFWEDVQQDMTNATYCQSVIDCNDDYTDCIYLNEDGIIDSGLDCSKYKE